MNAAIAIPLIGAIAGPMIAGLLAPKPQQQDAPEVEATPVAPAVATAKDAGVRETVVDQEAAKVRALKRRQTAKQDSLVSLQPDSSTSTKSLLGE